MMLICYCSDLHLEFSPIDEELFDIEADVLILAGDIVPLNMLLKAGRNKYLYDAPIMTFLNYVCSKFKHVLWVFGNHEFYFGDLYWYNDLTDKNTDLYKILETWDNLHVLNNEDIDIDGISFYGGTCWTDMDNDPLMGIKCTKMLNDFRVIEVECNKFTHKEWLLEHKKFLDNFYPVDVVISHHSPSYMTVADEYRYDIDMNKLYSSNLEYLMDVPKFWVFGHQHGAKEPEIHGCQLLNNARGYPGEPVHRRWQLKTFEI